MSNNQRLVSAFDHLDPRLSLSFAKLVMMSPAPAKSVGDARYASQFVDCPMQSRLQTKLGVRSFYVKQKLIFLLFMYTFVQSHSQSEKSRHNLVSCLDELEIHKPETFATLTVTRDIAKKKLNRIFNKPSQLFEPVHL